MNFFSELKRRNVFKVGAAYMIIAWLIMQAGETLAPALHLPEWVNSLLVFFLLLGFPLALFFAWAFEMTPEGIRKEKDVVRAHSITNLTGQKLNFTIIALLVAALGYFAWDKFTHDAGFHGDYPAGQSVTDTQAAKPENVPQDSAPDKHSIAVLPFVNMSDDSSNEFFSDGITEEVLNLLAKIPELKVTSRSSVFSFKGQNIHIPTVAEKLGVAHILEGSVRKAGNRVRITAQLIEASSDVHMWSETYDRELNDIFAIQDEIAKEVVTVLQIQILGNTPITQATDPDAFTAYLQGKHFLELASTIDGAAAEKAFRTAIEIDPAYAPAWAGLARTLRYRANQGEIGLAAGTEEARTTTLMALQLDDTLADAWASLARIQYVYDWDWDKAEGTARTALMHGPNNIYALRAASDVLGAIGKYSEALEFTRKAVAIDPLNPTMLTELGADLIRAGQLTEAANTFNHLLTLNPENEGTRGWLGYTRIQQGRPEEALKLVQVERNKDWRLYSLALIYPELGRMEEAEEITRYHIENNSDWLAYQIAEMFAHQGNPDKAFEWLEITYQQRDGGVTHLLSDHYLAPLHNDPRWEPYLLKVGLLDYWKDLQTDKAGQVE